MVSRLHSKGAEVRGFTDCILNVQKYENIVKISNIPQNEYVLAKVGFDTAESERGVA